MRRKLSYADKWIVNDYLTRIIAAMVKGDMPLAIMMIGELQGFGRGAPKKPVKAHIRDLNAALIEWYNDWAQTHPMK